MAFTRLIWSFQTHPGTAGFGGLDRNYDKAFQFGFYASIGWSNILHVEIQSLLVGLKLCWKARFRKFICYYDSLHVVQLVSLSTHCFHHYANMLEIIRVYMKKDWNFSLHQTLREGNAWADILAKLGVTCIDTLVTVYKLPQFLSSSLLVNIVGVSFIRT